MRKGGLEDDLVFIASTTLFPIPYSRVCVSLHCFHLHHLLIAHASIFSSLLTLPSASHCLRFHHLLTAHASILSSLLTLPSSPHRSRNTLPLSHSEINAMMMLHHTNVVAVKEVMESDSHVYLVMELCTGGALSSHINPQKPLEEPVARYYFAQLMSGECEGRGD